MVRYTGLQKDVLSLYRECLRAVRRKPDDTKPNFLLYTRTEFRRNMGVGKKDFATIEYLLRAGRRRLEVFGEEGVRNVG